MKRCSNCKVEKPKNAYHKNSRRSDGLQTTCKECGKIRSRKWAKKNAEILRVKNGQRRKERYEYINNLKSIPCKDCGIQYPPYVMDFDHRGNKDFTIARKFWRQKDILDAEIAKCDIVCSNCHRERTHGGNPIGLDSDCKSLV